MLHVVCMRILNVNYATSCCDYSYYSFTYLFFDEPTFAQPHFNSGSGFLSQHASRKPTGKRREFNPFTVALIEIRVNADWFLMTVKLN